MSDLINSQNAGDKSGAAGKTVDAAAWQAGLNLSQEALGEKGKDSHALQARLADLASGRALDAQPLPEENMSKGTYLLAGALAVGALGAAVFSRRLSYMGVGSEISSFVRNNSGHFAAEEARVLRSINWKAEAALPSVIDSRNPKLERLVIGKITDLERYQKSNSEFMLRWPDDKYDVLSKAQNLSIINRWLKRGGSIVDISPSQVGPGFLNSERAFIASVPKRSGQYLHRISGENTPPPVFKAQE